MKVPPCYGVRPLFYICMLLEIVILLTSLMGHGRHGTVHRIDNTTYSSGLWQDCRFEDDPPEVNDTLSDYDFYNNSDLFYNGTYIGNSSQLLSNQTLSNSSLELDAVMNLNESSNRRNESFVNGWSVNGSSVNGTDNWADPLADYYPGGFAYDGGMEAVDERDDCTWMFGRNDTAMSVAMAASGGFLLVGNLATLTLIGFLLNGMCVDGWEGSLGAKYTAALSLAQCGCLLVSAALILAIHGMKIREDELRNISWAYTAPVLAAALSVLNLLLAAVAKYRTRNDIRLDNEEEESQPPLDDDDDALDEDSVLHALKQRLVMRTVAVQTDCSHDKKRLLGAGERREVGPDQTPSPFRPIKKPETDVDSWHECVTPLHASPSIAARILRKQSVQDENKNRKQSIQDENKKNKKSNKEQLYFDNHTDEKDFNAYVFS